MQKRTVNYIALCALLLLAVFVANGAAGAILLSLVDDDEDGPAIESITFHDIQQLLLSQEKIQDLPHSTLQPCFVLIREIAVPVSPVQNPFPVSTRD